MGLMGSIGAAIGGSAASSAMQYHTSRKLQHDAQDWQEKMYKQMHQMEVADLRKAGLNPILSATKGAHSMPSSSVGSAGMPADPISNALKLAKFESEINLIDAQAEKTGNEAEVIKPEATIKGRLGNMLQSGMDWIGKKTNSAKDLIQGADTAQKRRDLIKIQSPKHRVKVHMLKNKLKGK